MNKVIAQCKARYEELKKKDEETLNGMTETSKTIDAKINGLNKQLGEALAVANTEEYKRVKALLRDAEDEKAAVTTWLDRADKKGITRSESEDIIKTIIEEQDRLRKESIKEISPLVVKLVDILTKYRSQVYAGDLLIGRIDFYLREHHSHHAYMAETNALSVDVRKMASRYAGKEAKTAHALSCIDEEELITWTK